LLNLALQQKCATQGTMTEAVKEDLKNFFLQHFCTTRKISAACTRLTGNKIKDYGACAGDFC